jgi:hypothetical protein
MFLRSFCRHTQLPTIDSLPLCPVFKGAKTNQKRQPFPWPSVAGCPKFIPLYGVLRRVAYPFFVVLLGGVKWHQKHFLQRAK